jgi:cytoskeletal protein CcmA (bactofilin family)
MFSQSADQPAADQSPAPVGMRELPPQPAKPVMPAYATTTPEPVVEDAGPGPDDSVIAKDDHLEGTFTSRGTVVVMGSVKGRIEAVQVRIEDGAKVDADVIVDEAIIAGEFTGNLTCRERLEARASGRINGRVETYKLMLHEGASVEGEMHMLTDSPKDVTATIRGTAPPRGDAKDANETKAETKSEPVTLAHPAATKAAPVVTPSSSAKPGTSAVGTVSSSPATTASDKSVEVTSVARPQTVADTLRAETLRVMPRAATTVSSYSGGPPGTSSSSRSSRSRNGSTTGSF